MPPVRDEQQQNDADAAPGGPGGRAGAQTETRGIGDDAQTRTGSESAAAGGATRWQPGAARVKVSDRLNRLVEETRRPDGQLWTITNLTEELTNRGHEVSRQYLSNLLNGSRENPPLRLLEALADVFAVPVAYFSDDYLGRVTNDLLPILVAAQDPTVRALLHRSDLPDVAAVLASVEQIAPTPQLIELLSRADLQDVAGNLTNPDVLAWVGDRPLADVLATLQAPVVQSAIEETMAVWLKYGTGPRK